MKASLIVGVRGLMANPLRTALSTLGVVIGVGALVAILAVGDGVERFAREQIERTTDLQSILIVPRTTDLVDGQRVPRSDTLRFGPADAAALDAVLAPEGRADIFVRGAALVESPGNRTRAVALTAMPADGPLIKRVSLQEGRLFQDRDTVARAHVIVISNRFARELDARIGSHLTFGSSDWTVIGVAAARDTSQLEAYIPIGTAADSVFVAPARLASTLWVRSEAIEDAPVVREQVEAWLTHRFGKWQSRIQVVSNAARARQASQAMLVFTLLMGMIAAVSLVVGGIGIMNVLLASVAERTREIGIRRSAGARRRDILIQFLSESVAVAGTGSLVGVGLGVGVAAFTAAVLRARTGAGVHMALSATTFSIAIGTAVVVGVAFGLYPALRAARITPVDAIRHE